MSRVIWDGEKIVVTASKINENQLDELCKKYEGEYLPAIDGFAFNRNASIISDLLMIPNIVRDPTFEPLANAVIAKRKREKEEIEAIGLPEVMYDFQKKAVAQMLKSDRNILLASDPGCGKTCMSAIYLSKKENAYPAVVVCPASLKTNWQVEIEKWTPNAVSYVISGRDSYKNADVMANVKKADVIIINYDILGIDDKDAMAKENERIKLAKVNGWRYRKAFVPVNGWVNTLLDEVGIQTIICDECQYIESSKAIRSRAVIQLSRDEKIKKLFLSGTPFETRVSQFYNACHILAPDLFGTEYEFLNRYCDPRYNGFGWEYKGLSHADELRYKLSFFMIRHKKEEVLKQLPSKQKIPVYLDMDKKSRKIYDEMEEELLQQKDGLEAFSYLAKMKKALVDIKSDAVIQYVKDMLEVEQKIVVFAYHASMFDKLMEKFKGICVGINGATPVLERQPQVVKFQNDPKIRLFIGQIQAASTGITLTAAHTVIFTEWGQTAAGMEQACDRIHRIGQTANRCTMYYLIVKDTIDEAPLKSLTAHHSDIQSVLNGDDNAKFVDIDDAMIAKVKQRKLMKDKIALNIEYE